MLNTLADNARKFTPEGGEVTLSAQETDDYVEISVKDTGAGMSEEQLQHLFDPKPIRDSGSGGHGFGLRSSANQASHSTVLSAGFRIRALSADASRD